MLFDNPAARLHMLLQKGRQINQDTQCRKTWEDLLQTKPDDNDDLFARLGKVMSLSRQTHLLLQTNFPSQLEGAEYWRSQLSAGFTNQNLAGAWGTFIAHIDNQTVTQLSLTAELIQAKIATRLVPNQDLERIQSDLQTLIADIDASDLTQNLKNYLVRELVDLQQAVRDYKVCGAVPILKQAESMVGHTLVDPEYKGFLSSHDLGKRLLDNLNAAAAVLTIALHLPQIGPVFAALLK